MASINQTRHELGHGELHTTARADIVGNYRDL
jgi:hypothetical protein